MTARGYELPHVDRIADSRDARWPGGPVGWTIRVLALVALTGAIYLAVTSWQSGQTVAGCGGWAFVDCEHVLTSRWARWLGVPVSYPAVIVYGLIALASFFVGPTRSMPVRRMARLTLVLLTSLAAGSAVWFLGLLIFAIGKLCLFCLLVHSCGLTIGLLLVVYPPVHRWRYTPEWLANLRTSMGFASTSLPKPPEQTLTPSTALSAAGVGFLGVAGLIAGQLLFPSKTYRIEQYRNLAISRSGALAQSSHLLNLAPNPVTNPVPPRDPSGATSASTDPAKPSPAASGSPSKAPEEPPTEERKDPAAPESKLPVPSKPVPGEIPETASDRLPEPELPLPSKLPTLDPLPGSPRRIPILDNEFLLEMDAHPVLGDLQAEHVVVELFDYTCKHCRAQSRQMEEAQKRYGPQLAVVLLPCPMSPLCNKHITSAQPEHQNACRYAKTALAVWQRAPSRFPEFHHWLTEGSEPPPLAAVAQQATRLVGDESWRDEVDGQAVRKQIEHNIDLFRRCDGGTIPKLLSGKYVVTGETATARQLFELLERITGIEPQRR